MYIYFDNFQIYPVSHFSLHLIQLMIKDSLLGLIKYLILFYILLTKRKKTELQTHCLVSAIVLWKWVEKISFKMESGSPKGEASMHVTTHGSLQDQQEEEISLPVQQQCTNHHNLKLLFFSHEILFKTTLHSFLKPYKSWPSSLCFFGLAYGFFP